MFHWKIKKFISPFFFFILFYIFFTFAYANPLIPAAAQYVRNYFFNQMLQTLRGELPSTNRLPKGLDEPEFRDPSKNPQDLADNGKDAFDELINEGIVQPSPLDPANNFTDVTAGDLPVQPPPTDQTPFQNFQRPEGSETNFTSEPAAEGQSANGGQNADPAAGVEDLQNEKIQITTKDGKKWELNMENVGIMKSMVTGQGIVLEIPKQFPTPTPGSKTTQLNKFVPPKNKKGATDFKVVMEDGKPTFKPAGKEYTFTNTEVGSVNWAK